MELWIGLGVLWVVLAVTLGIATLRKGHWVMFILGFVLPVFWVIGALMGPTEAAAAAAAPAGSNQVQ